MTANAAPVPREADPLCRKDPELFFAETNRPGPNEERVAKAKSICQVCPFVEPCLTYALAHSVVGIWGSTDPDERKAIRAIRGIVPEPIITNPYPRRDAA